MCIAIMKPENKVISDEVLQECFRCNSDGAGFMYAEDEKLHIHKGYMTFAAFLNAYKKHQDKKAILHFRITTHGKTDQENTHPFQVGESLGFVHNGIISAVNRDQDQTKSDTYHFNNAILKKIYKGDSKFIFKDFYQELIKGYVGASKLIFLSNKGEHVIINEKKGTWEDGVWYSNNSYKIVPKSSGTHQQQGRIYPVVSQGSPLQVGSRVVVKSHPTAGLNGKGEVIYFGINGFLGIKLDGNRYVNGVHISYVFPDTPTNKNPFQEGDLVCRKIRQDDVGIVSATTEHSCIVTFWDELGNETSHLIPLGSLMPWETVGAMQ